MNCHHCGTAITEERISREMTCRQCGSYLHCCYHCRFYDEFAYHQCKEPQAEWVRDKDAANFCDYFKLGDKPVKQTPGNRADEARKKLESLFKKPGPDTEV